MVSVIKPVVVNIDMESDDFVICRVMENGGMCGKRLQHLPSHLRHKHNMCVTEYLEKNPEAPLLSKNLINNLYSVRQKRKSIGMSGHNFDHGRGDICKKCGKVHIHHASGHTKYTHSGLAKASVAMTGRTKENNSGCAKISKALLGRRKETHQYLQDMANKLIGRTALTHPGVKAQADALRGRTKETHSGNAKQAAALTGRKAKDYPYIVEANKKRAAHWQDLDWVKSRSPGRWAPESDHHHNLKLQTQTLLESLGFTVVLERWVTVNGHNYIVDIWALKGSRKIMVEIGGCGEGKLNNLRILYGPSNIFIIPYDNEEQGLEELIKKVIV